MKTTTYELVEHTSRAVIVPRTSLPFLQAATQMKKEFQFAITAGTLALGLMTQAQAASTSKVASGSYGGLQWTARSLMTGAASGGTGTNTMDGNPIYLPSFPASTGVVGLMMETTPGNFVFGTGTLLPDRRSILTAAHLVSGGANTANPISTTVLFQPATGLSATASIFNDPAATGIQVTDYFVHTRFTGEVVDQNDIAVLRLAAPAPEWAVSHGIYTGSLNLTATNFTMAGYGNRGTGAGAVVDSAGRLRTGDNKYDFALGDAAFGGFFSDKNPTNGEHFFGTADIEFSYMSDFDNGLAANDAAGRLGEFFGAAFNDLGRGEREAGMMGGGDSGGPNFIGDQISGVNSYGLTFGTGFGDVDAATNNSFGEFGGYVPTYIHADFINAAQVPEPSAHLLMALGLAFVTGVVRRR